MTKTKTKSLHPTFNNHLEIAEFVREAGGPYNFQVIDNNPRSRWLAVNGVAHIENREDLRVYIWFNLKILKDGRFNITSLTGSIGLPDSVKSIKIALVGPSRIAHNLSRLIEHGVQLHDIKYGKID